MSYLTIEVEIDHGHVMSKGAESLPAKASGLLTILDPAPLRPIGLAQGQFTVPEDFNGLLLSETALAKDWNTPEEDAAWASL